MNLFEMLEGSLSKEELWFEEFDSSSQRTFENHKHEGEKEKARFLSCFGVLNTEEDTSIYRKRAQYNWREGASLVK
jgi:hypothetical protein